MTHDFRRTLIRCALGCFCLVPGPVLGAETDAASSEDALVGWAATDGGTTGGRGGPTVEVDDEAALVREAKGDRPATIVVVGPIVLRDKVRIGSNKTIVGEGPRAVLTGAGLHLSKVRNVIVRNLTIRDSKDDAINVEGGSQHVWIDHCDLSCSHDGLLDIKHGSDLVTVSWCRFHDHQKTCLLGHSDKASAAAEDRGKLRVTYHHNFFDGSQTRHPRVRFAETVHLFNNYYRENEYGAASTNDAGVLVEGNYFEKVESPTHVKYGDSKEPGRLVERLNRYVESGRPETAGTVAEVPYSYRLDAADDVPRLVRAGAGVRAE